MVEPGHSSRTASAGDSEKWLYCAPEKFMTIHMLHGELAAREQELSAIYENIPGILFYVAIEPDGDFRFLSISEAGLVATGLSREQFAGRLVREVIPLPSRDLVLTHYREAIRTGRTVRWREVSVYPAGRKVGDVSVTPLYDAAGVATHLIGIVHDVTERERLEEALRQREERLAFLLRLNDALRPLRDPVEIQNLTVRLVGEHLRVSGVAYFVIDGDDFIVTMSYDDGIVPIRSRWPMASIGSLLEAYKRGEPVIVSDIRTDPRFTDARAKLLSQRIVALLRVMLRKEGRWVATFGVNSSSPRNWTHDEIALIEEAAERMWSAAERARAETALRDSEERLRLVLDVSAAGSWTRDPDADHIDWDLGFRRLYGFAPDEPSSLDKWLGRVHEDDRQAVLALLDEAAQPTRDAWDITFRIVRPDGTVLWIQSIGRVERDRAGTITRLGGLELDVTARRHAEETLQARRDEEHSRELRLLLETAAQGIASVNARGLIVTANRALETMFGWQPGELIGQPIEQLVPLPIGNIHQQSSNFVAPVPRLMRGGLDLVGRRRDGSKFPIEVSVNHVPTSDGGRAIAFVTDITERRQVALALQERTVELERRSAQLSRLASELTPAEQHTREQLAKTLHDGLQQLLVSTAMNIDRLMQQGAGAPAGIGPEDPLPEVKSQLAEAIDAARSLSYELFPPVLERSGLPAALTWLADWTRKKYGLEVDLHADSLANSNRPDIRTLLLESVRELLFNAVKHARVDRVTVDLTREPNDVLRITVSDQGAGFDPWLIERAQTDQIGWGLFSIRERLTLLGGRFEIESAPGRGSRFVLTVPRAMAPGSTAAPPPSPAAAEAPMSGAVTSASPRALKILLVDDHAAMRKALRRLLQGRGELQIVGEAANGFEAIAQARALHPDVVVMDVSMPEMDGIEATRRIRAEFRSIQILGLSMYPRTEKLHSIEQAGAQRFFVKGADTQRLVDHLLSMYKATCGAAFIG